MQFFLVMWFALVVGCGASIPAHNSQEILVREVPWEDEEEDPPPIARLAPEWEDEEGNSNLPTLEEDIPPIATENPY